MALFNVIRYEGDTLVWRYQDPSVKEGITYGSRLIVNEGQEAVFFKNGQAFDVFGPGSHTLSTENIPLMQKVFNLPFGGKTPFPAEICFVNKTSKLDYRWGTLNPIQVEDPKYQVLLSIRAFGQYGLRIEDSRKLVTEFVGTMKEWKNKEVINHFNGLVLTCVQSCIAQYLVHRNISIASIMAYLDELSYMVEEKIREEFSAFGIEILNFYITSINIPETEIKKIREVQIKYGVNDNSYERYIIDRMLDKMGDIGSSVRRFPGIPGSSGPIVTGRPVGNSEMAGTPASTGSSMDDRLGTIRQGMRSQSTEPQVTRTRMAADAKDAAQESPQASRAEKASLVCPNCSARSPSGSNFCTQCSSSLKFRDCQSCGAKVSMDSHFCQNCRNPMI